MIVGRWWVTYSNTRWDQVESQVDPQPESDRLVDIPSSQRVGIQDHHVVAYKIQAQPSNDLSRAQA